MQHLTETLISHPTPVKSFDGLDMNRLQSILRKVRVIRSFQMLELLEKALPFQTFGSIFFREIEHGWTKRRNSDHLDHHDFCWPPL